MNVDCALWYEMDVTSATCPTTNSISVWATQITKLLAAPPTWFGQISFSIWIKLSLLGSIVNWAWNSGAMATDNLKCCSIIGECNCRLRHYSISFSRSLHCTLWCCPLTGTAGTTWWGRCWSRWRAWTSPTRTPAPSHWAERSPQGMQGEVWVVCLFSTHGDWRGPKTKKCTIQVSYLSEIV